MAAFLVAVLLLSGCLPRESVGDVGAPDLATVQATILTPRCATSDCHGGANPREGLNLEPGMSIPSLVGVVANQALMMRVAPGDSENSYLIHKLRGTMEDVGGSGERMPLNADPLSNAEIDLVAAWIDAMDPMVVKIPPPVITSVTPGSASTGAQLLIGGESFGLEQSDSTVTVGGVDATASVLSWSDTSIEVTVPDTLPPGAAPVVVTVGEGVSDPFPFDVLSGVVPSIIGIIPDTSVVGATVEVRGSNFGDTQGTSTVTVGSVVADTFTSWAAGSILVEVPAGATTGDVIVNVDGTDSNSGTIWIVEPNFNSIQAAIFDRRCVTDCHDGPLGLPAPGTDCPPAATTGALDLRTGMSYADLVGVDSCMLPGTLRVTPGDRSTSLLYLKLSLMNPPAGEQMPLDGTPTPPEVLEVVGTWIDSGAANN